MQNLDDLNEAIKKEKKKTEKKLEILLEISWFLQRLVEDDYTDEKEKKVIIEDLTSLLEELEIINEDE